MTDTYTDEAIVVLGVEEIRIPHTTDQVNNAYFLGRMFHHMPFPFTYLRDAERQFPLLTNISPRRIDRTAANDFLNIAHTRDTHHHHQSLADLPLTMSHFSADRSRSNQEYFRILRRLIRSKSEVNNHLSDVEQLGDEHHQLPTCLREEDLAFAINDAMANSFALGERAEFWQIEKDSLVKLIDRDGGWRKLGARLRLNDQKVLEFHIPTQFDANQPAIAFHHEIIASSINEHPLASRLPSPSQKPKLVACASDFIPLMRSKGDPEFLHDYLHTDRPIHLLFDGLGGKAVLDAWSLVLHGRDQEIPDLQGVYEDPLATLGTQPDVLYKHESRVMGVRQLILFGARAFLRRTFFKSDFKYYMVCIPGSYVKKLRSDATKDIAEAIGPSAEAPFISDSDVLCAWWSRYIASCVSKRATETFVINNLLGLRPVLTPELLRPEIPYVSNALMMMPTFVTAAELLTKPLGEIALSIRQTTNQLSTRAQVEARFSLDRAWQRRTGHPALYGDPWMRMIICTNWIKSKIYDVDFSPALLGRSSGNSNAVCPTYNQLHAIIKDFDLINGFAISKDADNNYWIYSQLDTKHRSKVEQMLSEEA
ncbi:hypothetical protein KCU71_g1315, partial [Aureobasidium melanogenum]